MSQDGGGLPLVMYHAVLTYLHLSVRDIHCLILLPSALEERDIAWRN